ncbi:MAG TPA: efflux RND transporter periplasmic adaptor subunit [Bryobacteraceae bacterium]|jgi:HlyD family secretion protein|nr:efflux RND transporter periplasmic adaptor subunit [Bryobacteraceae bacterium]
MDIKREGVAKNKIIRRVIYLTLAAAAIAAAGWRINQLKPAAPTVERGTVLIDTVKRGPMVRDVHGLGTLVPEDILWIQAEFDSQVNKILSQSGDEVSPDSVLLVLSNPQMEADATDFEWQTKQAEANYADLKVRLQSQTFDEQSLVATMQGDLKQAQITKEIEEKLLESHLDSQLNAKLAIAKWEQAESRFQMEKQKLDIQKQSVDAQLEAQRVQIEKLRATWMLKKKQVDDLTIRAGIKGRMQEMTLQVGQRVKPGDVLAKVAQPWKLMARLQITETQAKDILLGQKASIDTRNGIVPGHVTRIDASIVNGTRTVDCKLDGPLPTGAVPDLSVDGTIEIERLADVVYMQRPVFGQPNSSVSLFKLDPDGKEATRVVVRLGRASVNAVEILDGLKPGDQVILSEMSGQDQNTRIRLN